MGLVWFARLLERGALTPAERAIGYHDPADGGYRLAALQQLLSYELDSSA